jgi:hypothetical protein
MSVLTSVLRPRSVMLAAAVVVAAASSLAFTNVERANAAVPLPSCTISVDAHTIPDTWGSYHTLEYPRVLPLSAKGQVDCTSAAGLVVMTQPLYSYDNGASRTYNEGWRPVGPAHSESAIASSLYSYNSPNLRMYTVHSEGRYIAPGPCNVGSNVLFKARAYAWVDGDYLGHKESPVVTRPCV